MFALTPLMRQQAANNFRTKLIRKLAAVPIPKLATADTGPWLIDRNIYKMFMTHSTRRDLRASLYKDFITASEGEQIAELTRSILRFKKQLANIFGYENYTDYAMSTRMMQFVEIEALLDELHQALYPLVKQGYASLTAYAQAHGHEGELAPYDVLFWQNRMLGEQVGKINPELIEAESTRVYLTDVIQGAFALAHKLFGIKIEKDNEKTWHPDVSFYLVYNENGDHIGSFYLDPYRRSGKEGNAWMLNINARGKCSIAERVPVCYMATNFKPPEEDKPALLKVTDVRTFMHEFGHVLHYVLAQTDYHILTRVDRDMEEFASKLMENFMALESLASDVFPQHLADFIKQVQDSIDEGENISLSALQADAKNLDELFLSRTDIELHRSYDPDGEESPVEFLRRIANEMRILPADPEDEFSTVLVKILTSSSSANPALYIYTLGEIMARDVFALFKENGLEDEQLRATGQLLWDKFFAKGGSKSTLELFEEMRNRPLSIETYLQDIAKHELLVD